MGTDALPPSTQALSFQILGQTVRVECAHAVLRHYLTVNFGAMKALPGDVGPKLEYRVETRPTGSLALFRDGLEVAADEGPDEMLFLLEQDATVELQKRRSDLYFLHSAAIERHGKACLLAAESGSGKSTTAWGLLHHGFGYLSDELSPIDLDSMRVFPYAHALCLKRTPPSPYSLPGQSLRVGARIHIPAAALPGPTISWPCALGPVFLIKHRPDLAKPALRQVSRAEASAYLYVNALNALAHPSHGLDAVVRIAECVPCFSVDTADLAATCAIISSTVDKIGVPQS